MKINQDALNQIFLEARTHYNWLNKSVDKALLKQAYDLTKMGPTSANCQPMRIVFIVTEAEKLRLKPFLAAGNIEKTMTAPVTAIIAYDNRFYENLPKLFPQAPQMESYFKEHMFENAFRNSSLQGAYFIIALRAVGLHVGPMSGFDNVAVDHEFFPDGRFKSNFLCNIGYADLTKIMPRNPRLEFEEVCTIL